MLQRLPKEQIFLVKNKEALKFHLVSLNFRKIIFVFQTLSFTFVILPISKK